MLKTRVMPTLLYKDFGLVKGLSFDSRRRVGSVMQAVKVYNLREVDELVFLDVTATLDDRDPDFELIDDIADECFMPLTVGGGIRTEDHVRRLLQVGADRVLVNTAAVERPELIRQAADTFGTQCIAVSIDARRVGNAYEAFTHAGTRATSLDPVGLARSAEASGAGEILLTSIDRDGTMTGYDVELVERVAQAVSIPLIASGGAGNYGHMVEILQAGASAIAAAAMFHYTECTPLEAKRFLAASGIPVRL
jgi:imidazole glycerol-phosphate synthase subunit HisF